MNMNSIVRTDTAGSITASKESLRRPESLFLDTCNLLAHNSNGHMGVWAYMNGGRPHLEAFFDSPEYDGKREEALIPSIGKQFARDIPSDFSLIELGPGKAYKKKTSDFLDAFMKARPGVEPLEYIAVDVVEEYAREAAEFIREKYRLRTRAIVADYTTLSDIKTHGAPVLVSWNSPIWNSPISTNVEPDFIYASNLGKIGQLVSPDGLAILTHYPLRDAEKTRQIYSRENNRQAVLAIPHLIEKDLGPVCRIPGTSDTAGRFSELFKFHVDVNERDEYVAMNLLATRGSYTSISDYTAEISEGELFNAVRSAKPSIRRFNRMAQMSGAAIINTLPDHDGGVVAQALHFPNLRR